MNVAVPHSPRAFDEDLETERAPIARIGGMVEQALGNFISAGGPSSR